METGEETRGETGGETGEEMGEEGGSICWAVPCKLWVSISISS